MLRDFRGKLNRVVVFGEGKMSQWQLVMGSLSPNWKNTTDRTTHKAVLSEPYTTAILRARREIFSESC